MTQADRGTRAEPATTVRPMRDADVEAVLALERDTYDQPWPRAAFRPDAGTAAAQFFVAESSDVGLLGYTGLVVDGGRAHVITVTVASWARRRGIATRLLLVLLHEARRAGARVVRLEVALSNRAARLLYRRFGFAAVGVEAGYYRGEDALVMEARAVDSAAYGELLSSVAAQSDPGRGADSHEAHPRGFGCRSGAVPHP